MIGIDAMAIRETMIHGETGLLAGVAQEIRIGEALLGEDRGFEEKGLCFLRHEQLTTAQAFTTSPIICCNS